MSQSTAISYWKICQPACQELIGILMSQWSVLYTHFDLITGYRYYILDHKFINIQTNSGTELYKHSESHSS